MTGDASPLALVVRGPWMLRWAGVVVAIAAVVLASTHTPKGSAGGYTVGWIGNLFHVPLYGFLALNLGLAAGLRRLSSPWALLGLWAAVVLVGWLDEWHQSGLPHRDSSLWDLVSDAWGAGFGLALARWGALGGSDARAGLHIVLLGAAGAAVWGFLILELPPLAPPFLGSLAAGPS